jgi:hypothetical protein
MRKITGVGLTTVLVLAALVIPACSSHPASGATTPVVETQVILQYIPPSYYACSETTPLDLCHAYFGRYNNILVAEEEFNNQVFVFKNEVITGSELQYAKQDYFWLDGIIQCYFLYSGSERQLKVGEKVDVVGVDAGVSADYPRLLSFTGCVFLPAGAVQLPAGGNPEIKISSY